MPKGNFTKTKRTGRMPDVFGALTQEEIEKMANSPADEVTLLEALGLSAYQVEACRKVKKWKEGYAKGKAQWRLKKLQDLDASNDSAIQKEFARQVLPEKEMIENDIEITIDAPAFILKNINNAKLKRAKSTSTNS